SLAPTFTVATPNTPVSLVPGMLTIPVLPAVASSATISGVGVVDAESSSVFSPGTTVAAAALAHLNLNATSAGGNEVVGVIAMRKVWKPPGAMSIGVLGLPMGSFVAGFVIWY